ncbi:putative pentatricopeptide repeat-containing protein-like [Capsicum annuum]|nr:putative pentatricopeptide repeat-containing protein-like [Capsicum annuum]
MALSRLRHPLIFRAPSLLRLLPTAHSSFRAFNYVSGALNQIPDVDATSLRPVHFRLLSGVHGIPSKLQNGVRHFSSAGKQILQMMLLPLNAIIFPDIHRLLSVAFTVISRLSSPTRDEKLITGSSDKCM